MEKILDYINIETSTPGKDYVGILDKIEVKYVLKEGDWVYNADNNGLGKRVGIAQIKEITEEGVTFISYYNKDKVEFIEWEDNLGNKLEFIPFPMFHKGIKKKEIINRSLKRELDIFDIYDYTKNKWGEEKKYISHNRKHMIPIYNKLLENIDNIVQEQLSLF